MNHYIPRHLQRGSFGARAVFYLFFPLSILYLELVLRVFCLKTFGGPGLFYIVLFSAATGLLCTIFSSLGSRKTNTVVSYVLLILVTFICYGQTLYHTIFTTFMTLYSITGAGEAAQYWKEALAGVWASAIPLILMQVPLLFWSLYGKKTIPEKRGDPRVFVLLAAGFLAFQSIATISVLKSDSDIISTRALYTETFVPDLSAAQFGILTTLRLDIKNLMGLMKEELPVEPDPLPVVEIPPQEEEPEPEPEPEPIVYGDNVMDIDFDALIAKETDKTLLSMHKYFGSLTPTKKNEHTGLWKDKNLIWFCAEGFSSYAVDPVLTPTLYKLAHEGYVFENFYNPVWGVSTSDGEYTTCTGLIPKPGVWSFSRSGKIAMPFCLGNQLGRLDYLTLAYHNHTYTYYDRHLSHPNMGYDYKGVGNGLEVRKTWPESDLEMMEVTVPEYIDRRPFHVYYMTVSGHLLYNFTGNYIAAKNRDLVRDLPHSEAVQAYLACNIELDRALEKLLRDLDDAGILENTAIVLSGDHYPYGLEWEGLDALNEIAGHTLERNFELYKSTLIMWAGDMKEPEIVSRYCSSIDILPTISNLMGIEYDSRLLMGSDIFSDSPPLVVFSNRSWITDAGRYNSQTGEFTPAEGITVPDDYAKQISAKVKAMFTYSAKILETDYYSVVLGDRAKGPGGSETEAAS